MKVLLSLDVSSLIKSLNKSKLIAEYAKEHGFTVVTKDVDFVNLCKEENVPVGVLKGNRLYLISESIQLFGEKPANRLFVSD